MCTCSIFFSKKNYLDSVAILITLALLTACNMDKTPDKLPPHLQHLAPFDPHITSFECQIEAVKVPPLDAQAEDWFLEARSMEDGFVFVDDVDYKKVVQLTRQAAERHHWKAMLNLSSLYIENHDPPNGDSEAVALVSQAMELGVPAAFDRMGIYYLNGTGVPGSVSQAYAFFQKAAQMGNPQSMNFLGEKMDAGADGLKPGYWGNIPVAIKMFECALAQGYGPGAVEMEPMYAVPRGVDGMPTGRQTPETNERVMRALHEGVRGGCKFCALRLWYEFDHPSDLETMFVPFIDKARAQRYMKLSDALLFNPDRRFPNLDKILPLPPAELPPWDGQRDSLLAVAMAVVPIPETSAPTKASLRTGRYFLDSVYAFRPLAETSSATEAPFASYWQPTAPRESVEVREFLGTIAPGLYRKGETFEQPHYPIGTGTGVIAGIVWQRVLTVRNNGGAVAPRTAARVSRQVVLPEPRIVQDGDENCSHTGTWQPWVTPGHPLEQAVNQAWRQRWLTAGQSFPDPKRDWMLPLDSADLKWHLLEAQAPAHK